ITNSFGSITSDVVTVHFSPGITNQPSGQTVFPGTNVLFAVAATGDPLSPALSYQWLFNQTNFITGATDNTYSVPYTDLTNAGAYSAIVSNQYGSVTSSLALLTVKVAPYITVQPADQTVISNSLATFTVGAAGAAQLRYQWRLSSTNIANANDTAYSKLAFL